MRGLHVSYQPPHTMPRCLSFPGTPRGGLHLLSPPKIPPTQRPRFASKVKGTSFAQAPNPQRAFLEFPAPSPLLRSSRPSLHPGHRLKPHSPPPVSGGAPHPGRWPQPWPLSQPHLCRSIFPKANLTASLGRWRFSSLRDSTQEALDNLLPPCWLSRKPLLTLKDRLGVGTSASSPQHSPANRSYVPQHSSVLGFLYIPPAPRL